MGKKRMKPRDQVKALALLGTFILIVLVQILPLPESELKAMLDIGFSLAIGVCIIIAIDIVFNEIEKTKRSA